MGYLDLCQPFSWHKSRNGWRLEYGMWHHRQSYPPPKPEPSLVPPSHPKTTLLFLQTTLSQPCTALCKLTVSNTLAWHSSHCTGQRGPLDWAAHSQIAQSYLNPCIIMLDVSFRLPEKCWCQKEGSSLPAGMPGPYSLWCFCNSVLWQNMHSTGSGPK